MPKKAENMRATLATEGAGLEWRAIDLEVCVGAAEHARARACVRV